MAEEVILAERDAEVQGITQDIVIQYNPKTQALMLKFKPQEFKSFEFIQGILKMAELWTENMRMMAMQMQAQQQMQSMQAAAQNQQQIIRRSNR